MSDRYYYHHCKGCCWDTSGYCPIRTNYGCVEKNGCCQGSLEQIAKDKKFPLIVRIKAWFAKKKQFYLPSR